MKYLIIFITYFSLFITSCSNKQTIIGLNQRIHHDDFEYSVIDFYKTDKINNIKADGNFYIVTIKVENMAKKIVHEWDNNIAYIVDENDKEYNNLRDKQILLNADEHFNYKELHKTSPGAGETTKLIFDIPEDVKTPYLKMRGEFLMGDLFDGNQYKHTMIKLF